MINDNVPAHLRTRKQLADFAKRAGTTPEIARKVELVRQQMCAHRRRGNATTAAILERNVAELARMTASRGVEGQ